MARGRGRDEGVGRGGTQRNDNFPDLEKLENR